MHFSNNPAVNRRVCEMTVRDLPFKNLVLNTSGIIRYPAAEALLALANGRLFSRGGTVRAGARPEPGRDDVYDKRGNMGAAARSPPLI